MKYLILILTLFYIPAMAQTISTVAGTGEIGNTGDGGPAISATINYPCGFTNDKAGNIYFTLGIGGNGVRKIATDGTISRIAGSGSGGYSGDGENALSAEFNNAQNIAIDTIGNLYIADAQNYVIRKIDKATNIVTTIAGNGSYGTAGVGGPATAAQLLTTASVAVDKYGNVYVGNEYRVLKVNTAGIISSVAGTTMVGYSEDGGLADTSKIMAAHGLTVDDTGNLYIADGYCCVRKVNTAGIISRVIGNGVPDSYGDGGPATAAACVPTRIKLDKFGNMYITEYPTGNKVRMVGQDGIIHTIAGTGEIGFDGDGGPAVAAKFYHPIDIAFDSCNNLYIGDLANYRIRKISYPFCNYVGVQDVSQQNGNKIYPNPSSDKLYLKYRNSPCKYAIKNLMGSVVGSGMLDANTYQIDISTLNAGSYLLYTESDNKAIEVQTFIKL